MLRWLGPGFVALMLWLFAGGSAHAADGDGLAMTVVSGSAPRRLCPGEVRRVQLRLRNVGTEIWRPEERDNFAYHWRDLQGAMVVRDGRRTPLPGAVEPGASVELVALVSAPDEPGRYRWQPAIVREQVRWAQGAVASATTEVVGAGTPLAWSRRSGGRLEQVVAGETSTVDLEVRNDGCAQWSREQPDAMAYRWYDTQGRIVVREGRRSPLPELLPGQVGRMTATVDAPAQPGEYRLVWQPVREGVGWFSPDPTEEPVAVGPSPFAWAMHVAQPRHSIAAGERLTVEVALEHLGTEPWSSQQGDALSYRWFDEAGAVVEEGPRTALPTVWLPGDADTVSARLFAPATPGRYVLRWGLVREGVRWFGPARHDADRFEVEVTAPRLAWAVDSLSLTQAQWVHREGRFSITVRNTGAEAWVPARGDRFSYRWYEQDGITLVADGMRTSLPGRVEPGESVTLFARVKGPPRPGTFVLVPELVREHVRWYGPPTAGRDLVTVSVQRLSGYLVVLLGAAVFGMLVWLRRSAWSCPRAAWWSWRLGPALLAGAAVGVVVHCFVDLSGAEPWDNASWVVLGPGALLSLSLLPLRPRAAAMLAAVVLVLLTVLSLADLAYLHFFGSIVPLSAVLAVHHLSDAEATVTSLLQPAYTWLLVVPLLSLVVAVAWPRRVAGPVPRRWVGWLVAVLVLGAVATPMVRVLVRAFGSGLSDKVFSEERNVGRLGIAGAHLFQLLREGIAAIAPPQLSPQQRDALAALLDGHRQARREAAQHAPGFGAARGYDVVLIQVEALQGWVVGAQVDGQPITPFLDAATEHALYFDQIFDQTAQGRTSDAEYLVLNAGHPIAMGALAFLHDDNEFYTLAHVLADGGYSTASAHPYKRGFWNRARMHPNYGFASSKFRRELGPGPVVGWGLSDAAFFERVTPDLLAAPSPAFHFLITLSLHHPYDHFPAAMRTLDLGALDGKPVGNYLQAMRHFDDALAELWGALQDAGRAERTLLVIYGDHVTGMGEPPAVLALAGRPTWDPAAHGELHRVPVFAWVGETDDPALTGRRSKVGGHIDIGPTVLHLLGIDDPRPAALGHVLLDPRPGFAPLSDGGAVTDERLLSARGRGISNEGACFTRDGERQPRVDCDAQSERAGQQLDLARLLLQHDLHRRGAQ